eukprot:1157341-Pelagomonas_calceolata.AAC.3
MVQRSQSEFWSLGIRTRNERGKFIEEAEQGNEWEIKAENLHPPCRPHPCPQCQSLTAGRCEFLGPDVAPSCVSRQILDQLTDLRAQGSL